LTNHFYSSFAVDFLFTVPSCTKPFAATRCFKIFFIQGQPRNKTEVCWENKEQWLWSAPALENVWPRCGGGCHSSALPCDDCQLLSLSGGGEVSGENNNKREINGSLRLSTEQTRRKKSPALV
jgi:hypothetical protein